MSEPLLPALATKIREWFPELEGRALAVSDATITRENMPTLPLCMVALVTENGNQPGRAGKVEISIVDQILVEFMLKAVRLKSQGTETAFWAFYDYEAWRNKLLQRTVSWVGPSGERLRYVSLNVDVDQYSANLSFRFDSSVVWCDESENEPGDGLPAKIDVNLCTPKVVECDPCLAPTEKECDPCA